MNANIFNDLEKLQIDGLSNAQLKEVIARLKNTKVNVLFVGGTGVGKSSTINALFNKTDNAKVGQSTRPETSIIESYELNNLVIWDTPGFGDSAVNDARYKEEIINKLNERDNNGHYLIDLVLLIIDGSSRDYSSAYMIIKDIISPNLGLNADNRLLVGINQADMAMKGKYWNASNNQPEEPLKEFLEEKVASTRARIKEDTGLDIEPIYFSAGYKDGDEEQHPYNLSKLLSHLLRHLPGKKRASVISDINKNEENFESNDQSGYNKEIEEIFEKSFWENLQDTIADLGTDVKDSAAELTKTVIQEGTKMASDFIKSETAKTMVKDAIIKLISQAFKGK